MRKIAAVIFAIIIAICSVGCKDDAEYISFHGEMMKRADLSQETIQWLERYNELTEEEQLAISYIPGEIHEFLYGEALEGMDEAAEAGN